MVIEDIAILHQALGPPPDNVQVLGFVGVDLMMKRVQKAQRCLRDEDYRQPDNFATPRRVFLPSR
jgi:hypothetical protein